MDSTDATRSVLTAAEGGPALAYTRRLQVPARRVLEACSSGEGLATWIGELRGDAASGDLEFSMTAEGSEAPWVPVTVRACTEAGWDVELDAGLERWRFTLRVIPGPAGSLLRFEHRMGTLEELRPYATGWEYYLDRLERALAGGDVSGVDFGVIDAALSPGFEGLFAAAIDSAAGA
ncbi:MAG: hypothetical protein LBE25_07440 [Arthrobacter sp.]|jgi:uncharacterized protein YndB with AHSA1/START domain|nr:hypothetical protein [Arthrobacter sp.]